MQMTVTGLKSKRSKVAYTFQMDFIAPKMAEIKPTLVFFHFGKVSLN